jgi:hypothetical protein
MKGITGLSAGIIPQDRAPLPGYPVIVPCPGSLPGYFANLFCIPENNILVKDIMGKFYTPL